MEAAIAALLTQKNHEDAARVAGIGLNTLSAGCGSRSSSRNNGAPGGRSQNRPTLAPSRIAGAATTVLLKLMVDPNTPASSRIRAALGILDLSRDSMDLDIETRVSELERASEQGKPQGR